MEELVGKITHFFSHINVAVVKVENGELNAGDTIRIKGMHTNFTQKIGSMQVNKVNIEKAKKGDDIGMKVDEIVRVHDEVFLVKED